MVLVDQFGYATAIHIGNKQVGRLPPELARMAGIDHWGKAHDHGAAFDAWADLRPEPA